MAAQEDVFFSNAISQSGPPTRRGDETRHQAIVADIISIDGNDHRVPTMRIIHMPLGLQPVSAFLFVLFLSLLNCFKNGIWIGRRLQGFGMLVVPVTHVRKIASKLLKQHDDLGGFLFGQQIDLKFEMRAILLDTRHAILPNEHRHRDQDADESDNALQQRKRRFVEVAIAHMMQKDITDDPSQACAQKSK